MSDEPLTDPYGGYTPAYWETLQSIARMEREIAECRAALEICLEFFKDRYDADCQDGQWVGNKEMRLGMMIDEVLQKDYRR